ncbi:MAG: hypothetical protein IPP29_16905 [Bacteroidetes bacterium]|nr:hypothetical protein [Bacteroidota bacterium]
MLPLPMPVAARAYFIPEKGEEVIVDFEGGDVDKPFVFGSMYNGKAKSGHGDGDNNTKGLQSRSGNKMMLDDKEGSVFLADKTGADTVMIDGKGHINIDCTETFTITCGDSSITMDKAGKIDIVGKNITINGTDAVGLDSKKSASAVLMKLMLEVEQQLNTKEGGDANLDGAKTTVSGSARSNRQWRNNNCKCRW